MKKLMKTYEPADMRVTGFGGMSPFKQGGKQLNFRQFEENGKCLKIDAGFTMN